MAIKPSLIHNSMGLINTKSHHTDWTPASQTPTHKHQMQACFATIKANKAAATRITPPAASCLNNAVIDGPIKVVLSS